ncbi:hypothetical protein [Gordonia polyisoprenivorans]|uniref:hypothetical protein n=1 Tax=Gordonia polyisoprenivorans TaxID=84595 RepID=UPI000B99DDE3|nr:hypothetical protein [Gordonia polyisoprenivorans]OZC29693.1 hypothetical protein CJJ17_23710 [Gordonia polyisoprenivorans]
MTSVSIAAGVHSVLLAADQQPQGPEFGKASPLGLLIIILLLICTALLIWSMNRQLRKLPKTFDTEHPEADQAFDEGTDSVGPTTPQSLGDVNAIGDAGSAKKPADT